jgi:hypothetical protein
VGLANLPKAAIAAFFLAGSSFFAHRTLPLVMRASLI